MQRRLDDLADLLRCPGCGGEAFEVRAAIGLACRTCGIRHGFADGVLTVDAGDADPAVEAERAAVQAAEARAAPSERGGTGVFDEFARATGALRAALLSLPWGDGSPYFDRPGYFSDVRRSAEAFEFVRANLGMIPGARLLDVGADFTWSTAALARSGFDCTAIDINHHLPLARLFQDAYGLEYRLVNVDAHVPCFRSGAFDVITAFAALHHSHRLGTLIDNLAASLVPGGRLGFVEPFCVNEEERRIFGREQIEQGINENVYTLDEWHATLTRAGFEQQTLWLSGSFNAVYVKADTGRPPSVGPLARFYAGALEFLACPPATVVPGGALTVRVRVRNRSNAVWSSGGMTPVCLGYHIARVTPDGPEMMSFDNPRSDLPRAVPPGASAACDVAVIAPTGPGRYRLTFDLVHERVSWFHDRGLATINCDLTVQV